jgi:2-polyprenyl-3-methyl-5-hydroxy-6-metoxy-1,4-benzoquinol methylase
VSVAPASVIPRPSPWFTWHDRWIRPGSRVLDLACGEGRHSIPAAALGAQVTAVDRDEQRLDTGRQAAERQGVQIEWVKADLEQPWPDFGKFDAVLVFNYLDRGRMGEIRDAVAPGGVLVMETFLTSQTDLGWGPTDPAHLLQPGELVRLVAPFEVLHGREVLEPLEANKWRAVASIVAERPRSS